MEKLSSMRDEMVRLLREEGADDAKVLRYTGLFDSAEQKRKDEKVLREKNIEKLQGELQEFIESRTWPCPMCFTKEPRVAGEIKLFGRQDGSSSAKCECGHLVTDFADPWIEQKKAPD